MLLYYFIKIIAYFFSNCQAIFPEGVVTLKFKELFEMQNSNRQEELYYLANTLAFIRKDLNEMMQEALAHRKDLVEARRDMVENTTPFSNDFERLTEMVQFLSEVSSQTVSYTNIAQYVARYKKLIDSPYFGRFDFVEDGFGIREKIYIGLANIMDRKTHDVYVYDWRAPISSIFYRYEKGRASYETPVGASNGEVMLKRQYKINNSTLEYFFDCDIRITDEILQDILGRNSSPKMKNIVETIQKEQDIIIRDTENELLMVQGTAGSGKTSIAMHRIAFLLYEGRQYQTNNILIISPNDVFSQYISSVLPDLGEENVRQVTFDDLVAQSFNGRFILQTKEGYLEDLINHYHSYYMRIRRASASFKSSRIFQQILDRWLDYYAHKLIPFEDVYFNGVVLETRQQLKNRFLRNEIGIPMAKQLERLENMILPKTHPYKEERLAKIKGIVAKSEGRDLEIKQFSRLLAIKESESFRRKLRKFTTVDYWAIYQKLFADPSYVKYLADDLPLPEEIEDILRITRESLSFNRLEYEDYTPLLYLKLKIEGTDLASAIRHVVIDEAQDYSPIQYEIFKMLYKNATYTVLGDINQTIVQRPRLAIYDDIALIFNKVNNKLLTLRKSYRSTREIIEFSQMFLPENQHTARGILPFDRHGSKPRIICQETRSLLDEAIIDEVRRFAKEGYATIAVICKSQQEAENLFKRIAAKINITLIQPNHKDLVKGPVIISSYLAKGLEYDAVIIYDVNHNTFSTDLDRKLLYIACSRALHELVLFYTGERSFLLKTN